MRRMSVAGYNNLAVAMTYLWGNWTSALMTSALDIREVSWPGEQAHCGGGCTTLPPVSLTAAASFPSSGQSSQLFMLSEQQTKRVVQTARGSRLTLVELI
mmetsp:Transcript_13794/g.29783  ORF Transcript_13794/g.29783 Transcript_13794/m.29783 type:complete len:100 (-) Transcript_13794:454-753(-)